VTFGAVSVRIGELAYGDFAWPRDAHEVLVQALDRDGTPVMANIAFTAKWAARGWHQVFACPCCGGPARVLRVHREGLSCGRCRCRPTAHHARKGTTEWRLAARTADGIVRTVLRPGSSRAHARRLPAMARELSSQTIAHADAIVHRAARILAAAHRVAAEGPR
jgi:hypothetical protein